MRLDYADWLTPEHLVREERLWARDRKYVRYAACLYSLIQKYKVQDVEEFGCGTGWVPTLLHDVMSYTGYDRNVGCLALAREKNIRTPIITRFEEAELRTKRPRYDDCVCAFAVLKHFGLDEAELVFRNLFETARVGAFTIPISTVRHEDVCEFTHSWWDEALLSQLLQVVEMREVGRDTTDPEEPLILIAR